ncbi:mechanosensitive ion channel protein MscL [Cohnella lubricantis]|uniref:Mechanosensitive ion channel protein MscL n=1 Tax=Cohnella lubricantis TaxID=2163172 RepID=A0A841TAH2_9BACL|nr:mechanosensitive ion channel protein MscL [Cohnella lubricantis]MBB6676027.1 mechanosensitive ion channel protein MscL [Cohnella lubricantis]MBP2117960.1 hypothetical protein [Cohnella lubricantis]
MIVFDVIVDGVVRETIRPDTRKLRDISRYMNDQLKLMGRKYGYEVHVKRRMVY